MKPRDIADRSREMQKQRRLDPNGSLRKTHAAHRRRARQSARDSAGVPRRQLHDDRRKLVSALRQTNSNHDEAATDCGMIEDEDMLHAARFKLERVAHEFAHWRVVREAERSPALPRWRGVAIEIMIEADQMPSALCELMDISAGASYAHAASRLMSALSGQTSLPAHDEFRESDKGLNQSR